MHIRRDKGEKMTRTNYRYTCDCARFPDIFVSQERVISFIQCTMGFGFNVLETVAANYFEGEQGRGSMSYIYIDILNI